MWYLENRRGGSPLSNTGGRAHGRPSSAHALGLSSVISSLGLVESHFLPPQMGLLWDRELGWATVVIEIQF